MSNGSSPHSIRTSSPVDPSIVRVLRPVDRIASELRCPFFVAGATARDLMLVNVYGLRPGRATRDIDFGIAVQSWDQFQSLKEQMIATGEFSVDLKAQQRLLYTDRSAGFSSSRRSHPFSRCRLRRQLDRLASRARCGPQRCGVRGSLGIVDTSQC